MTSRHSAGAPPLPDGRVRVDERSRAAAADDFGHLVHRTPDVVLLPRSAEDVATAIRWAADRGRTFAAQGRRHSVFGRAQADAGIVADMTRLSVVRSVGSDRVEVDAGARWREVLAATLPRGLTPPVLTDYLDLTVGGTLVVGGIGGATSRFGAQTDNVLELEVVTGTGERVSCSPSCRADLYDAVRAGLGQVGVVTRASLPLVAAPQRVRRGVLTYPTLTSMLHDERLLVADRRFDVVQGAALPAPAGGWIFRLEVVKEFSDRPPDDGALLAGLSDDRPEAELITTSYLESVDRLAVLEQVLRSNGQWSLPHPWLTTFVGDARVEAVVEAELDRLTPADLGPFGRVVVTAFRREAVATPLLRLPSDSLYYAVNLIRIPTADRGADTARLVRDNRVVYDRVRSAGGTLYPVSALPMSRDDWRDHFGPAFRRLIDAKQRFDPGHVLTPGYDVFRPRGADELSASLRSVSSDS